MKKLVLLFVLVFAVSAMATPTGMQITEWMYKGGNGEFVEFTNFSSTAIDMNGWSYSDAAGKAGDVSLSAFGAVASGQSVVLTETAASTFRTAWGLSSTVDIIGSNAKDNMARSDAIKLYDSTGAIVDQLTYNDQTGYGPRTENKSCTIPQADLGLTTASSSWTLSVNGVNGAWTSTGGDVGSPGYNNYNIPEPATITLLIVAASSLRHRRK